MSTGISADVDDWPFFSTFLLVWSLLIVKLQIFLYSCDYKYLIAWNLKMHY